VARPRKLTLSPQERESRAEHLAITVRARREELDLRQDELADLAECSTRFIHTIEHAKETVRLDKLLDVLEVLGFTLELRPGPGGLVSAEE
jgi:HTH-type transcriptional regulator / antitoxin HipB